MAENMKANFMRKEYRLQKTKLTIEILMSFMISTKKTFPLK